MLLGTLHVHPLIFTNLLLFTHIGVFEKSDGELECIGLVKNIHALLGLYTIQSRLMVGSTRCHSPHRRIHPMSPPPHPRSKRRNSTGRKFTPNTASLPPTSQLLHALEIAAHPPKNGRECINLPPHTNPLTTHSLFPPPTRKMHLCIDGSSTSVIRTSCTSKMLWEDRIA